MTFKSGFKYMWKDRVMKIVLIIFAGSFALVFASYFMIELEFYGKLLSVVAGAISIIYTVFFKDKIKDAPFEYVKSDGNIGAPEK